MGEAELGLIEAPGAVDGPVAEVSVSARQTIRWYALLCVRMLEGKGVGCLPREAQRAWREGVLEVVSYLGCLLLVCRCHCVPQYWKGDVLIRLSFFGPCFLRFCSWGDEEKGTVCDCFCRSKRQPLDIHGLLCELQKCENALRSAVDGGLMAGDAFDLG